MFRTIRRAPWIALGATAAYYLDSTNGPARRRDAAARARALMDRAREQLQSATVGEPTPNGSGTPWVGQDSGGVVAAEHVGVTSPVLADAEWSGTEYSAGRVEHRRSEDTVAPAVEGVSGVG